MDSDDWWFNSGFLSLVMLVKEIWLLCRHLLGVRYKPIWGVQGQSWWLPLGSPLSGSREGCKPGSRTSKDPILHTVWRWPWGLPHFQHSLAKANSSVSKLSQSGPSGIIRKHVAWCFWCLIFAANPTGLAVKDRVLAEQIPLFDAGGEAEGVEKVVVKPAPEDTQL